MKSPAGRKSMIRHCCVQCGKVFPHRFTTFCDSCDGMIDVEYDLGRAVLRDSFNPLERFFDLLPIVDPANLLPQSMERTPCIHARTLGGRLGMPWLFLKDETVLPTGTTKDRMAAVALAFLRECGIREFCTSSTGNSSSSFAHAIARYPDCRLYLFTAEDFWDRVSCPESDQVVPFVLRDASFVDAFTCAGDFAHMRGLTPERGFFNPARREGLKLAFFEAVEQVPRPIDWYVQAVSSAMGVYGAFKGALELLRLGRVQRLPRLLCVQQDTCSPMVRAHEAGSDRIRPEDIVHRPHGIAKAILRGDPSRAYPYVRKIVLESKGTFAAVSEREIRDARVMAEELEGIVPCFSASSALAGLIKLVRQGDFPRGDTVLINISGRDREPCTVQRKAHWLRPSAKGWVPEDPGDGFAQELWQKRGMEAALP
jgi:threonine synthase